MAGPGRLVVLASGAGSNLGAILDAIDRGALDASVELVVVNRRTTARAVERAERAGVPTAVHLLGPMIEQGRSRSDYDRELARIVVETQPALVVLAGWMHILSDAFLTNVDAEVVNVHPALPGAFPGRDAIGDALDASARGEIDRTGVMVHLVPDEGVDEGPVLASEAVAIEPGDTRESLAERIHVVEHRLLVGAIADRLAGR